jgi:hypothetical protein
VAAELVGTTASREAIALGGVVARLGDLAVEGADHGCVRHDHLRVVLQRE